MKNGDMGVERVQQFHQFFVMILETARVTVYENLRL